MKIAINACFGGFSLSEAAVRAYAQKKGLPIYPELGKFGLMTYWVVPENQRVKEAPGGFMSMSIDERKKYNETYRAQTIYDRDIPRDDADLIAVIEEMGEAANGEHARLRVIEIPDDVQWQIDDYDGNESISEVHRTWG